MIVFLLVAVFCTTDGCRDIRPNVPLSFPTEDACIAAASDTTKQGAAYECRIGFDI